MKRRFAEPTWSQHVDGVIKEDRLGLDTIYLQAKRWQNAVDSRELQGFVGALAGQGANKGVFINLRQKVNRQPRENINGLSAKIAKWPLGWPLDPSRNNKARNSGEHRESRKIAGA